ASIILCARACLFASIAEGPQEKVRAEAGRAWVLRLRSLMPSVIAAPSCLKMATPPLTKGWVCAQRSSCRGTRLERPGLAAQALDQTGRIPAIAAHVLYIGVKLIH